MKKIIFISFVLISVFYVSNKMQASSFSYGIPRTNDHSRPNPGRFIEKIIEDEDAIYIGDDNKNIYLTFDCGYETGYTNQILDVLKETNTKACFFITGHYLTTATDIVKRMQEEGHIVGNHFYGHKDMSKITNVQIKKEIESLETKYKELIGYEMSNYIRPPKGVASSESLAYTRELGYKTVFWSLAYVDWYQDKTNGKEYSYNNVVSRIHNGAIILMHTVSKDNSDALEDIIVDLTADGYNFSSLDELVHI